MAHQAPEPPTEVSAPEQPEPAHYAARRICTARGVPCIRRDDARRDEGFVAVAMASPSPARKTNAIVGVGQPTTDIGRCLTSGATLSLRRRCLLRTCKRWSDPVRCDPLERDRIWRPGGRSHRHWIEWGGRHVAAGRLVSSATTEQRPGRSLCARSRLFGSRRRAGRFAPTPAVRARPRRHCCSRLTVSRATLRSRRSCLPDRCRAAPARPNAER